MVLGFGAEMTRAEASIGGAVREGSARLMRAPAVLAGTIALAAAFAVGVPLPGAWRSTVTSWTDMLSVVRGMLFWSFLSGGILDRYARDRATRGRGFFGACGAHFPAMLRLGLGALALTAALVAWVLPRVPDGPLNSAAVVLVLFALTLTLTYAQIRIVVEDRRSAGGAVLAASRFIRRNPAAAALHGLIFAAALTLEWARLAPRAAFLAVGDVLILLAWASGTVLFQSRLAHASYTAGPPVEWPESPAAEAIRNAAATPTT
jgi:hypothetical protein